MNISIKSKADIQKMREGGRILKHILKTIEQKAQAGMSTQDLDNIAHDICRQNNVQPSFFGFHGFPGAVCASINNEIVHGIPSPERILQEGDMVSIDCGVYHKGLHTDSCITFVIDKATPKQQKLMDITKMALDKAIKTVQDGVHLGDVSNVIQRTAENAGFSIVENLTGHGIGREIHEEPQILNYGDKGTGIALRKGMTIAIEPIVTAKSSENYTLDDGWTIVSADGGLSAHFEHTVVVHEKCSEILT